MTHSSAEPEPRREALQTAAAAPLTDRSRHRLCVAGRSRLQTALVVKHRGRRDTGLPTCAPRDHDLVLGLDPFEPLQRARIWVGRARQHALPEAAVPRGAPGPDRDASGERMLSSAVMTAKPVLRPGSLAGDPPAVPAPGGEEPMEPS
jgi:hypothetical protein